MVYTDQTSSFRSLISEGSSRSASPSGRDSRSRDRRGKGKGKGKGKQDDEVFIQEAYRIVSPYSSPALAPAPVLALHTHNASVHILVFIVEG